MSVGIVPETLRGAPNGQYFWLDATAPELSAIGDALPRWSVSG